mgnify:CR=1 FL=1
MADQGAGAIVSANRDPQYGNSNMTTGRAMGGEPGNFAPNRDSMGNVVTTDFNNQTGFGPNAGLSATSAPHEDPRSIGQNAEMRVKGIAEGIQYQGYNDRQKIYRA